MPPFTSVYILELQQKVSTCAVLVGGLHSYQNLSACFTRLSGNNLSFSLLMMLPQNHFLHTVAKFGGDEVIIYRDFYSFPTFDLCLQLICIERIKYLCSLFPHEYLHLEEKGHM